MLFSYVAINGLHRTPLRIYLIKNKEPCVRCSKFLFFGRINDFLKKCLSIDVMWQMNSFNSLSCLSLSCSSGISASCNLLRLICMPRTEGVFTKGMGVRGWGGEGSWRDTENERKRELYLSLTQVHTHIHTGYTNSFSRSFYLQHSTNSSTYTIFRFLLVCSGKNAQHYCCPGYLKNIFLCNYILFNFMQV